MFARQSVVNLFFFDSLQPFVMRCTIPDEKCFNFHSQTSEGLRAQLIPVYVSGCFSEAAGA